MSDNANGDMAELESRLYTSGNSSSLGSFFDQQFFAIRPQPGEDVAFPFESRHFTALLSVSAKFDAKQIRKLTLELLNHGMRAAICQGDQAELASEIIDELIDEHQFTHDGQTAYSSFHDDGLTETLEYFTLPTGLADTGLIIILGDESDYEDAVNAFSFLGCDAAEIEELVVEAEEVLC